jgi:hypothetical protein
VLEKKEGRMLRGNPVKKEGITNLMQMEINMVEKLICLR